MNKIKVIKKGAGQEADKRVNSVEERSPIKSNGRETVKTVEGWIADWRASAESEARRAIAELTGLRLEKSNPA
jgi:predicted AAA+ superfamily ATPase